MGQGMRKVEGPVDCRLGFGGRSGLGCNGCMERGGCAAARAVGAGGAGGVEVITDICLGGGVGWGVGGAGARK